MRRDVRFEVFGVPELAEELAKPLDQKKADVARLAGYSVVVQFLQEVISNGFDVAQCL